MEKLKNNGEQLSKDVEHIIQNYLKLFGLKQTGSLAIFIGLISSVILITTLFVFYSFKTLSIVSTTITLLFFHFSLLYEHSYVTTFDIILEVILENKKLITLNDKKWKQK